MKNIQWFPGHMAKTRRLIQSNLPLVDGIVEILDARTPLSSRNPEMDKLTDGKPKMILLNKSDMADDKVTAKWIEYFKNKGITAIPVDCKNGKGVKNFLPVLKSQVLKELLDKWKSLNYTNAFTARCNFSFNTVFISNGFCEITKTYCIS